MNQQIPVGIQMSGETAAEDLLACGVVGVEIGIPVDARTTACSLRSDLTGHEGWPGGLTHEEIERAVGEMIGEKALRNDTRLFPDVYPEELPRYEQGLVDLYVAELPDGSGRWAVIDGINHAILSTWESYGEAMCAAWSDHEEELPSVYRYYVVSVPVPEGYEVEYKPRLGSWVWYRPRSYGRLQLEGFNTETDARVDAWRHKLELDSNSQPVEQASDFIAGRIVGPNEFRNWTAEIHHFHSDSRRNDWLGRIEVHGRSEADAEQMRNRVLEAVNEHPLMKAIVQDIHRVLDGPDEEPGIEWDSGTIVQVARILEDSGFHIHKPGEEST